MRTPAWCRRQAAGIGPACEQVIGELLAENALYRLRSAQGVLGLADARIAMALAPAGLQFTERWLGEVRLPLKPGKTPASSRPDDGRFDARPDEVVDIDNPDFAAKLNAGWLRMAIDFGLFNDQREFLLPVTRSEDVDEPERAWARVRLIDEWDIAGSGVEELGSHLVWGPTARYVPEFWALSLDQRVLLATTI